MMFPTASLVPKKIDNLLVACRAVGMTHDAHQLFRMQRDIQALGESAAVAAKFAIASRVPVPPRQRGGRSKAAR